MTVSFIIPVFNVEHYLSQCVKSISCQTYRDVEIILVDDGSPDNSPALCDQLANEDSRIIVIHKINGGLSDARNAGLLKATGDYVVFVDGDDFWTKPEALEQLMLIAEKHQECDFIGFNCSYYYPLTNVFVPWVEYSESLSESSSGSDAIVSLVQSGTFPMSACLKLLKRKFLVDNSILFIKGQIAEDIPWFINILEKCNNCCFINHYFYAYRQNVSGSITNTSGERSFKSLLDIVETEVSLINHRNLTSEAKDALYSFLAYELCILFTYSNPSKEIRSKLKSYSWLIQYDMNPKVRRVRIVKSLIGLPLTVSLLKIYNKRRNRKKR